MKIIRIRLSHIAIKNMEKLFLLCILFTAVLADDPKGPKVTDKVLIYYQFFLLIGIRVPNWRCGAFEKRKERERKKEYNYVTHINYEFPSCRLWPHQHLIVYD